jgi:hypothetical protein
MPSISKYAKPFLDPCCKFSAQVLLGCIKIQTQALDLGVCVIRWASVAVGRAHWLVCFYDIMSPVVARCMLPSEHSKNSHCLVASYCMDLFWCWSGVFTVIVSTVLWDLLPFADTDRWGSSHKSWYKMVPATSWSCESGMNHLQGSYLLWAAVLTPSMLQVT